MAWTTPKQWAASELLTASDINQYISDNLSALYALTQGGGRKNLLHNGAFQVAQRGTSTASITTNGYYTADRWASYIATLGTWTNSVESDAPTGSGFRKSWKWLCTTADASPAAGDYMIASQHIEGQNLQSVKKGTASAQQLTMSFWVKSNKTGTYVVELEDVNNHRYVSAAYTISSSATWEQKAITFPADLTGSLNNDANAALGVYFWLSAGSDYTGGASLQTTWAATTANKRAYGQTNLAAATNNYWQITGVQLEVGSAATGFEWKDYGTELAECQRYYWLIASGTSRAVGTGLYPSAFQVTCILQHPVPMRIVPSWAGTNSTDHFTTDPRLDTFNKLTVSSSNSTTSASWMYNDTEISGATAGVATLLVTNNANAIAALSADL